MTEKALKVKLKMIMYFKGATKVGGLELVDDIAKGKVDVAEIDHFIAHEDMALELKPLLGTIWSSLIYW